MWVSSTTLTCSPPAHAPGAVDVVVTNPDGSSATGINAYTYGTFDPAAMGAALWVDAQDASTIGLSGSNVTHWNDKSGHARNLTPVIGNPLYQATSGPGGKPCIQIDGSTNLLTASHAGATEFTVIAVFKINGNPTFCFKHTNADANGFNYGIASGNRDLNLGGGGGNLTDGAYTAAFLATTIRAKTGEAPIIRESGTVVSSFGTETVAAPTAGDSFGLGFYNFASSGSIQVCEFVLFDSKLSDTDMANGEAWIRGRWGV